MTTETDATIMQLLKDIAERLEGQNPWRSGRPGSGEDQFGEGWDDGASENRQPGTEIIPERDVKLGAGLGEAKEGIAAVATEIAASAAANLAPSADISHY